MKTVRNLLALCAVPALVFSAVHCVMAQQPQQSQASQQSFVVRTKEILSYRTLQGQPQWEDASRQRVQGARWQFNSNGTFVYSPTNSRSDLFPLRGTYHKEGNTVVFSGQRTSQNGYTGSAQAQISGKMYTSGNEVILEMRAITTSGSDVHVNGQAFTSASGSAFEVKVSLR